MKRNEVPHEVTEHFNEWINREWDRCMALRGAFENHAIVYLLTANGGGVASVMAFAGSAQYATPTVFHTLTSFLLGLLFCGLAISIAMHRMAWIARKLSEDQQRFNSCEMGINECAKNHKDRFNVRTFGTLFGYASFGCFLAGIWLSVGSFNEYMLDRAKEKVKTGETIPAVPTKGAAR